MSIVVILLLLVLAGYVLSNGARTNPLSGRQCQGRLWRSNFPTASKRQIREFLAVFVDAFAMPDFDALKFRPDDQLLSIYKALYPSKWLPDAREFETLARELMQRYGIALADIWDEQLTLGALFSHVQQVRSQTPAPA